ncbi:MAG: vitamin B12 dependent methionine synthase [Anaerolineae bacterium]|nr:vitamin B12 dependent methionine synthase [Anaerolineae bacterium]
MSLTIIDAIPFQPDRAALAKRLRVRDSSAYLANLQRLVDEAEAVARLKALYKVAFIDDRGDDYVVVDGVRLDSRVLSVNLEPVHRVFPYVATCGVELDAWAHTQDDMLYKYWADGIKEVAVREAIQALFDHMTEAYGLDKMALMSPGSLDDWPMPQQQPLFNILGDVAGAIGVQLSDSFVMTPNKSLSGLWFATGRQDWREDFASCQLCPRENCPGRHAPYDDTLYDRKYRQG